MRQLTQSLPTASLLCVHLKEYVVASLPTLHVGLTLHLLRQCIHTALSTLTKSFVTTSTNVWLLTFMMCAFWFTVTFPIPIFCKISILCYSSKSTMFPDFNAPLLLIYTSMFPGLLRSLVTHLPWCFLDCYAPLLLINTTMFPGLLHLRWLLNQVLGDF